MPQRPSTPPQIQQPLRPTTPLAPIKSKTSKK